MIDWNALVLGPTMGVFGEPVTYNIGLQSYALTAVFDEAFTSVDALSDPGVMSVHPVLGVRLSELPAGYDPENAQGDRFTVGRTGITYVVKSGRPDSHGHARLDANLAP